MKTMSERWTEVITPKVKGVHARDLRMIGINMHTHLEKLERSGVALPDAVFLAIEKAADDKQLLKALQDFTGAVRGVTSPSLDGEPFPPGSRLPRAGNYKEAYREAVANRIDPRNPAAMQKAQRSADIAVALEALSKSK